MNHPSSTDMFSHLGCGPFVSLQQHFVLMMVEGNTWTLIDLPIVSWSDHSGQPPLQFVTSWVGHWQMRRPRMYAPCVLGAVDNAQSSHANFHLGFGSFNGAHSIMQGCVGAGELTAAHHPMNKLAFCLVIFGRPVTRGKCALLLRGTRCPPLKGKFAFVLCHNQLSRYRKETWFCVGELQRPSIV